MTAGPMESMVVDRFANTQPRYVAYCIAHHSASTEEMLARDRIAFPGGHMAGYINWIVAQWRAWRQAVGVSPDYHIDHDDHLAFDRWLDDRVALGIASNPVIARTKPPRPALTDQRAGG